MTPPGTWLLTSSPCPACKRVLTVSVRKVLDLRRKRIYWEYACWSCWDHGEARGVH